MILLSDSMIRNLEKIRFRARMIVYIRAAYGFMMCGCLFYIIQRGKFDQYSYIIVSLLLTTFIINSISDFICNETDIVLNALEYDKSKIKYNSLDTKF